MKTHVMKNVALAGGFVFIATFGAGAHTLPNVLSRTRHGSA